ncbi:hypothetical protein CO024_02230 [Candidatus Gracilibacteria bacterium CG_4_9_14_0_2_um_filter_38_7]|nr:MAG: hypothetical protein AUJ87_02025 [Candidatus Gracilibacteria bacterium CG1_02_38_174]PIQ11778.1 MAG: hypothetical protein COW68_01825 [Candidatus Gracilibacteria bacterium CG18_big_fil_WC_8_21_14_2_50_38_16]PIQ41397.1 MAG: hypothetical protein COW06_03040 [Candidatus Gracilibacteria bacterium CG12_big_fil_rev_8_21_14_0_65_38_15]PIZ01414.1 MAG: hypothetical protein COY60_03680 [Candidatus Gracilibacteria bacterium CG_4_10_14_0_8_um_filter_38_28]PJC56598.1 MAG: hypothetical protein CO024_
MLKKSFEINKSIYGEKNIQKMIEDFSDFALDYKNGILSISGESNEEIEEIFRESMNYLIALYNENI